METRKKTSAKMSAKTSYNNHILAEGYEFSEDTRITGRNNNVMILGGSGAGKTGSYVVPNIQNLTTSLVCADTKRQLAALFTKELEDKGFDVKVLDFVNPRLSCGYNPLDYVEINEKGDPSLKDIRIIVQNIWPGADSKEPIWDMCTWDYLCFLISLAFDMYPEEERNLMTVAKLHSDFQDATGKAQITYFMHHHPDCQSNKQYKMLKANMGADKMWASIMGFANAALAIFVDIDVSNIFASTQNKLDIIDLGRKKTVAFLNVSDTDGAFDPIVNLFYSQVLQKLCKEASNNKDGRLKQPVRIIMDDFAASTKLANFDKIMSIIRSRDIYVSIILQAVTQLNSMYSEAEAATIINNCDYIAYYGGQDNETVGYVSRRACIMEKSVRTKKMDQIWIMANGEEALLVKKIPPYSTLKARGGASKEDADLSA